MRSHQTWSFGSDDEGVVAVEFVVTLPLILAALVFVFEFGRALLAYEIMSQDVRSSLRYLSRAESADLADTSSGYVADAIDLAQTGSASATPDCPSSYPSSGTTNCHYPWTSASTISVSTTPFSDTLYNVNGSVVTMTASAPITLSMLWFLGRPTYTLTVSDQAQYMGD